MCGWGWPEKGWAEKCCIVHWAWNLLLTSVAAQEPHGFATLQGCLCVCLCCRITTAHAAGRAESKDGLEVHMQTNHLSHFLLTLGLLPALQRGVQQPPQPSTAAGRQDAPAGDTAPFRPRIVSVASAMHHFGYKFGPEDPMQKQAYSTTLAYGNSKLAQVVKALALAWLESKTMHCCHVQCGQAPAVLAFGCIWTQASSACLSHFCSCTI